MGSARHQYGISALVTQTSFCESSSGDLAKRRLFSQANFSTPLPRRNPQIFSQNNIWDNFNGFNLSAIGKKGKQNNQRTKEIPLSLT